MKLIILVALAVVAVAVAAPPASAPVSEPVKIVRSEFEQKPEGGYSYEFETEDGVVRQETGEVKEVLDEENKPHKVVVVRGSYSYTDPEGHPVTITYVSDETGYHADGDSIPKVPARR